MSALSQEDMIQALSEAIAALPEGKERNDLKQLRLGISYGTGVQLFSNPCNGEQPLPLQTEFTPVEDLCESYVPPKREMIRNDREKAKPVVTYLTNVHGCPKVVE